jgi:hypothetical protein
MLGTLIASAVAASICCLLAASPAMAMERRDVWLSPDAYTPDMLDLFRRPELWARARERVGVFKFAPPQVDPGIQAVRNSYAALKGVDAFAALRQWGIKIATEEGAVKEWDCAGTRTPLGTEARMANIAAAGATLQIVAMDEPLVSGRGPCALPVDEIAKRTAAYVAAVRASKEAKTAGEAPEFGDIEPYPSIPVPVLIEWVKALEAHGFKPAFLHLDINAAIGQPDQAVFQSWVTRSPIACSRSEPECAKQPCSPADPPYCGEKSIPLNLPDDDPAAFTQTRLVRDVLALFGRR